MKTLLSEMNAIFAERRTSEALTQNIPSSADGVYDLCEENPAYSEPKKMSWTIFGSKSGWKDDRSEE